MKTISTMALALALCSTAFADDNTATIRLLNFGTEQGPGIGEPGMLGLALSPDGKYVCGTLENQYGIFMGNLETNEMIWTESAGDDGGELRHVNNQGVAIGYNGDPGILYNMKGIETILTVPTEYKYVVGEDLTEDGSVMVGELVGTGYTPHAAYKKDGGEWTLLPIPEGDLGDFGKGTTQTTAKFISNDGKIILGAIHPVMGPATLWRLNDAGEYDADPIFMEYAILNREGNDDDRPYMEFSACGLSPNGKYVLIQVREYINGNLGLPMPAVYDTETEELEVYNEVQDIDTYEMGLHPTAIANDGTFIGMMGGSASSNYGAFIMKAGQTQAQSYMEAFPEFRGVIEVLDLGGYHLPAAISADGRYLLGNGWYSAAEDPTADDAFFYWMTYVIDRGSTSGIGAVSGEAAEALPTEFYSIDGKRLSAPVKGINIVRMSDGTTRKIMK